MVTVAFPMPKNEDDFERLCRDLFAAEWESTDLQRHGRRGQRQHGVDIFGRDRSDLRVGIQCKLHEPPHELTEDEVMAEVEKAKGFSPPLARFIVATTARRDGALQRLVADITERHRAEGLFAVQVRAWDDISELLAGHPTIAERLFPTELLATQKRYRDLDELDQLFVGVVFGMTGDGGRLIRPGQFLSSGRSAW